MSAQHVQAREWRVFVHSGGIGDIGSVAESNEANARCAALGKFGEEGERGSNPQRAIFADDDFDVRPA